MTSDDFFLGYRRADGRFGIRNHVLILSPTGLTTQVAHRIHAMISGTICVCSPYGRGQVGADAILHFATLSGLVRNPNVAAVVVLAADNGIARRFCEVAESIGKPCIGLSLPDVGEDSLELSLKGARAATRLVRDTSRLQRSVACLSQLSVAIECGHSDATSGMIANPFVGDVVTRIVAAGGQVVFSETLEWTGAEHVLARRAGSPELRTAIRKAVATREAYATAAGEDVRSQNPGPQNIAGGLSTIEEKALGAISKGGRQNIAGLLQAAERPVGQGLFLMDTPYFSPESITAMVAGGCQLVMFTTGPGNSYCSAVAPTIKVSANSETCGRLPEQIDFTLVGLPTVAQDRLAACEEALRYVRTVASGELTLGEITGEGSEAISRLGPSL